MTKSTSKIELSTVKRKYNGMSSFSHLEKRKAEKKMADKIPAKGCVSEQESAGRCDQLLQGRTNKNSITAMAATGFYGVQLPPRKIPVSALKRWAIGGNWWPKWRCETLIDTAKCQNSRDRHFITTLLLFARRRTAAHIEIGMRDSVDHQESGRRLGRGAEKKKNNDWEISV